MSLTNEQIRSFEQLGMLKVIQAVPPEVLHTARDLVHGWIADRFDPADIVEYTNRTFAPELGNDPRLLAVFNESRLRGDCASLFGPDDFEPVRSVQIALRMPRDLVGAAEQPVKPMHVDGVNCAFLPPGTLRTFTLNVGVMLDDVPDPRGGALHYVPAGHQRMAQWLRDGGLPTGDSEVPNDLATLPGRPFCGQAGDAAILHHLLPHRVGANATREARIMLYFRVRHVDHDRLERLALTDPWVELPGVRQASDVPTAG